MASSISSSRSAGETIQASTSRLRCLTTTEMRRYKKLILIIPVLGSAFAQSNVRTIGDPNKPLNDLPTPYRTVRDWGQLPAGMKWAAVTAVEPSPDGSIYVIHRCFANSCAGRTEPPILKFDKSGKLLRSFGEG